jgi:hypothetical protein
VTWLAWSVVVADCGEKELEMGAKKTGIQWGTLAAIATIIGVAYTIWHSEQEDAEKQDAAAARIHHARIVLGRDVEPDGTSLIKSWGTLAVDPMPPIDVSNVTVKMDNSSCEPLAIAEVDLNDVQLTLSRCSLPRGSTGILMWTDPSPATQSE